MDWAKAILRTIWELFIDDGAFGLAIPIWLMLASVLHALGFDPTWDSALLFAGLAALLCHSTLRKAGSS
jgi:hypothetical protein